MDALPGMSQAALPEHAPVDGKDAVHACGHNLFGAGSVAAARAIAQWLRDTGRDGEVRVYGTPAEEGGSGKVYLVRAGAFDYVVVVLHWHPCDVKSAPHTRTLATASAPFPDRPTGLLATSVSVRAHRGGQRNNKK